MENSFLREQCLSIIKELAQVQAWPLPIEGVTALTDAILPFVTTLPVPNDDQIRLTALNYYTDGPTVQAMLTPGSATGEQLWHDWQTRMVKLARQKGLSAQDAEDLVQTTFLQTRRALQKFQFKSQLKTYFYAIVNRQYAKWLQGELRVATTDLDEDAETTKPTLTVTGATAAVENAEIRQLVMQEIQKIIKSQDYQILYWYYVETNEIDSTTGQVKKWTDKTIGEHLGMPINTVTARRLRALARLRDNSGLAVLFRNLLDAANDEGS